MGWCMPRMQWRRWRDMLEGRLLGMRWRLSLLFPALLTALLLIRPDSLALSCVLASAIHEAGHLLAMVCLRCPPTVCTVGAFGVRLELQDSTVDYGRRMMISLAGPAVNALAAGILLWVGRPLTAAVHLCLMGLNLLPAAALDGGQVLYAALCLLGLEPVAGGVLRFLSAAVLLPLAAGAFWLFMTEKTNPTLLIVSGYLVVLIFFSPNMQKST